MENALKHRRPLCPEGQLFLAGLWADLELCESPTHPDACTGASLTQGG